MRSRFLRAAAALTAVLLLLLSTAISVAALDDTYEFDDLDMSVKIPKSFLVITRSTARMDEVFQKVDLDYDETMTAFRAANIFLRAYEPEGAYQISLTVLEDANSAAVNNYSDLTAAQRQTIADAFTAQQDVSSVVEVKHGGNIFFDYERQTKLDGKDVYISQCNTIVNGMQIDLSLQKNDEPATAEESKVLTNAAASLSFETIRRDTGPVFDWWRVLLWAMILVVISVAVSIIYRRKNEAKQRLMEERRRRRAGHNDPEEDERLTTYQPTFEESLGYSDEEEFKARADADDMAASDISVKEKDPSKGVVLFEDEGSGIDDGTDYFDTYFEEQAEKRSFWRKALDGIVSAFKIAATHTGYFFKNIFKKIFKGKKNKDKE